MMTKKSYVREKALVKAEADSASETPVSSIIELTSDLHDAGLITAERRRRYDALLAPLEKLTSVQVREIRINAKLEVEEFALLLNVPKNRLTKWELGSASPSGSSLKLLDLVRRKGVEAIY